MARGERRRERGLGARGVVHQDARHAERGGNPCCEGGDPIARGVVDEVLAVEVEAVEQAQRQRARPRATGRATGRDLKRERSLIGVEGDRLAVEHGVAHRQRACDLDDLGHARGHVVEAPAEDRDVAVAHVHLHAHSVELPLRAALSRGARSRSRHPVRCRRASARADARPRCGTPRARALHRRAPPRRPSGGRLPAGARGVRLPAGPPRPAQPRRSARRRARPGAGRPSGGRAGIAARRPSHGRRARPRDACARRSNPAPTAPRAARGEHRPRRSVSVGSLAGGGGSPSPR